LGKIMKALVPQLLPLMIIAATVVSGCTTAKKARVHSVSIAVTTIDGNAPSQEQAAQILASLMPEIERAGFQVAKNAHEADFVVSVKFTKDAEGKGGRVSISGMEPSGQFRGGPGMGESDELKEIRRRIREMDAWAARQVMRTDP
jgi:hypothetical protein